MGARRHHVRGLRAALCGVVAMALALPPWHDAAAQGQKRVRSAYGAIAYHPASESFGYAFDFSTERAAELAAIHHCGRPECEIAISFCRGRAQRPA